MKANFEVDNIIKSDKEIAVIRLPLKFEDNRICKMLYYIFM